MKSDRASTDPRAVDCLHPSQIGVSDFASRFIILSSRLGPPNLSKQLGSAGNVAQRKADASRSSESICERSKVRSRLATEASFRIARSPAIADATVASGPEFQVNTYTLHNQKSPKVASDDAGDYVVVWNSHYEDGSGYGVYAQRYNSTGAAQGSEFQVNTYTSGNQEQADVAMDSAGDFVVVWET